MNVPKLTVGSLFSGAGMYDLGFLDAEYQIKWQCDNNDYCQKVLEARRDVFGYEHPIYGDVRDLGKGRRYEPEKTDVIIGGFPCQPFSVAGLQEGASDSRNMWPDFARLIGELQPRAIMLENVPAITLEYGLTVVGNLTEMGYDCRWGIISAQDFGAFHRRERWWLVGYSARERLARNEREKSSFSEHARPSGTQQRDTYEYRISGTTNGITYRLDGYKFPNGKNQEQHIGEVPRTTSQKGSNWTNRMKILGNGGLPQIAYSLAVEIRNNLIGL